MTILATLVVLGVLIFVHELGHFWAARSVGIRVERFSIGLGPRVYGFTRGDTEYVISAIPLGGYVKMAGMDDEVMEQIEGGKTAAPGDGDALPPIPPEPVPAHGVPGTPRDHSGDFDSKPVWARTWVISAGVIMNMIFAFFAYTAVAAGWGSAENDTLRLGDVRAEFLESGTAQLAEIPTGVDLVGIGDRSPGHWGEVRDAFLELPAGPTVVRYAGPSPEPGAGFVEGAVEVVVPESRDGRIRVVQALESWLDPVVGNVEPGTPAARAGLRTGDRILEVDGTPVERWYPFTRLIQARPDAPTTLLVERNGDRVELQAVPDAIEALDTATGETRVIGRMGVLPMPPPTAWARLSAGDALVYGARQTWGVTVFIVDFLKQLLTGQASPRNLGSIVTIGEISGQAAAEGLPVFLSFMALLSINLAILNLLPIPVLDGGHLVFLALEAIRGRPVSVEQRMRWSQVGFVVLIGIMVLALGNDFMRLFGL